MGRVNDTLLDISTEQATGVEEPWAVLLWNDPVNTMEYVARALKKVFGMDAARAHQLMMEAHQNGRTEVWSGERAEAERHCAALHGWTLQATLTKAGS